MTDILEMIPDNTLEQKRRILLNKTCGLIKMLYDAGQEKESICEQIKEINLPFDVHIAVMGRFSEICRFGRILSESERKIFKC
jgi:hypothetical protein